MLTRKRKKKLKLYAKNFCNQVFYEYGEKLKLTNGRPNIKFYTCKCCVEKKDINLEFINDVENKGILDFNKTKDNEYYFLDGLFRHKEKKIEIYNIFKEKPAKLRQTIRHECLHFLLYESGHPYEDDSPLFILLALKYNADPYALYMYLDSYLETLKGGM